MTNSVCCPRCHSDDCDYHDKGTGICTNLLNELVAMRDDWLTKAVEPPYDRFDSESTVGKKGGLMDCATRLDAFLTECGLDRG